MQPARRTAATGIGDLRWLSLGLLAGAAGLHGLPELPPWWLYLVGLVGVLLPWSGRWLLLAALIGAAWAQIHAGWRLEDRLPLEQHHQDRWLTGWVVNLPEQEPGRLAFSFAPASDDAPAKLRVNWYRNQTGLRAGDCVRLLLRLRAPRGLANPGGFDSEAWLFREGLGATAYVRDHAPCPADARPVLSPLAAALLQVRQAIVDGVKRVLPEHPMRGVILGLTVGDASAMTDAQWQALRRTGTTHLISISGLHVALVAGVVLIAVRRLWMLQPRLCLILAAPKAGVYAAALAAMVYSALAGFSIPTQRSLLMLLVVFGALVSGRTTTPSRVLALALMVVLLREPGAVLYPGFWLSFLAVAWIAYLMSARLERPGRWHVWVWLQLALALALAPPSLYGFGETSLVGPLANFVLIPLFSLVIPILLFTLLLLALVPVWGAQLLEWNAQGLMLVWHGLDWLASLPQAYWIQPAPALWVAVLACIGLFWMLAPRGWPSKSVGAFLCLPLLIPGPSAPPAGSFDLTLLDVGQGLSAVVRTRQHVLLFDTGPGGSYALDAGDAVVVPYLRSTGVTKLDALVLSHDDLDHRGGLAAVRMGLPILQEIGTEQGSACRGGRSWEWDGVRFELLHPRVAGWRGNNASCVLKVSAGSNAVLLPGDIERQAEQTLVAEQAGQLEAEVLVMPHHGSATSSTEAFLDAVRPQYALAPAGWRNRFRHPRPQVLARYQARDIPVFTTGETGALSLRISPAQPITPPRIWRSESRRIWRYPVGG